MRILFLTPRLPYPPVKGDKSIPFHRIKYLSRRHEIILLSFIENKDELRYLPHLDRYCSRVEIVLLPSYRSYLNLLRGILSDIPFQVSYYSSPIMRERLEVILTQEELDLVHAVLLRSAHYLMGTYSLPKVVDLIDALSLNMERRHQAERGVKRMFFEEECRRVRKFEREVCRDFDKAVVVSHVDRKAIGEENVEVVPLGVDSEVFKPPSKKPEPNVVIFTGNLGYFPNIEAVSYFAEHILPLVVQRIPEVEFLVVGANPPHQITRLDKHPNILVTGTVDSVADHLRKASVAVCPMKSGSGMQFKILEAMACGVPVVATGLGLEGMEVTAGEHALVGDTPEAFADHVIALLRDEERSTTLARKARRLVEQRYSWRFSGSRLENVYEKALAHWRATKGLRSEWVAEHRSSRQKADDKHREQDQGSSP